MQRFAQRTLGVAFFLAIASNGCNINIDSPAGGSQGAGASGSTGNGSTSGGTGGSTGSGGDAESRCLATTERVLCSYEQISLPGQLGVLRDVVYQLPLGTPPSGGFPVVILFQGSFNGPAVMFDAAADAAFGAYHLATTIKGLLDAGYAVVAPEAHLQGDTYWDTNIPPWSLNWAAAPDHAFMLSILAAIPAGKFGPLDASRQYATGISSGGYMTSRMAVSYQGQFKALAVHSGSYATCSGALCVIPDVLPSDHPPTLFLHGEKDPAVPISTMKNYDTRLQADGKETRVVTDPNAGHEWIPAGAQEVVAWFNAHP